MDKRKLNWITMAFVILTVLVVSLMLSHTLRRSSHITLPEVLPPTDDTIGETAGDNALAVVEILPETVQTAIETLDRPDSYSRAVMVEQVWSGGSGTYQTDVSVRDGWTRTDRIMPDGQVRHAITDGAQTYIWYNDETEYVEMPAGIVSADNEQSIPTYEDVLELPVEIISDADYREISGLRCIYVETAAEESGYALRYWVSVDSGLLVAAEKLLDGETIYRMGSLELDEMEPAEVQFTLPNGTSLL